MHIHGGTWKALIGCALPRPCRQSHRNILDKAWCGSSVVNKKVTTEKKKFRAMPPKSWTVRAKNTNLVTPACKFRITRPLVEPKNGERNRRTTPKSGALLATELLPEMVCGMYLNGQKKCRRTSQHCQYFKMMMSNSGGSAVLHQTGGVGEACAVVCVLENGVCK